MSSQQLLPGARWVQRRGKHQGNEVEIDHTTDQSVFFKTIGGGSSWGNQKTDDSQLNRLALSSFRTLYSQKQDLEPGESRGGRAFRRVGMRKITPVDEPAQEPLTPPTPLQLNGYVMAGSPLNIEVLEITPEMARTWLTRGGANRKLNQRLVDRLSTAIRDGEWMLTGDSIKLAEDSTVIDGQHRLHAIVDAGLAVTSLVVRNVAPSAMSVIDTGRTRTAGDVLAMHGHVSVNATAAAARGLLLIERFGRMQRRTVKARDYVTHVSILRYVEEHPDVHDGVRMADTLRMAGMAGGSGLLATFCTLILRADAEQARVFVDAINSGANLEKDSPILRLRNRWLNQQRFYGSGDEREAFVALAIKAWNAWRKNEDMQVLIWREREGFPVPV